MLPELITWVLNTYFGKYLENFNPAQLSIAMISGAVELENVPIRRDSLRSFGIPVQVLSGCIEKIKLQIPVRQIRTSPWSITIEKVYGVLGPKDLNEWDAEKETQDEYEYKIRLLDSKEANWRVQTGLHVGSYYSSSYSSWLNYIATLASNVFENLELRINDVHLRYEDTITVNGSSFATGIRIKTLSAQSCDSNWSPNIKISSNDVTSFKLIELKDMFIYWDKLNDSNTCNKLSSRDLLENMNNICKSNDHQYFINPINATAKFKRERCKEPIRTRTRPRISCDVSVQQIKFSFNDVQYSEMIECCTELQSIKKIRAFRILRPKFPVKANPKLWWLYALKCHGFIFRNQVEKWQAVKDGIRYIKIYMRLLLNPNTSLSADDKQFKMDMERMKSLNELYGLRDACYKNFACQNIQYQNRNINQSKRILYHWFPNWWGWYRTNSTNGNGNHLGKEIDEDAYKHIEDDILIAIKETIESETFSKRDAVFGYFTFTLADGELTLNTINNNHKNEEQCHPNTGLALVLEFKKFYSFIEVKPRLNSYCIGVSLGSVSLIDKLTKLSEFPYLIRPHLQMTNGQYNGNGNNNGNGNVSNNGSGNNKNNGNYKTNGNKNNGNHNTVKADNKFQFHHIFKETFLHSNLEKDGKPWFQLRYEKSPLEFPKQHSYRFSIKSESLDVVYNESMWRWLISFFVEPFNIIQMKQQRNPIQYTTKLKFLRNWKNMFIQENDVKTKYFCEIDIFAPRIICVDNFHQKNSLMVLIDFGRFQLVKDDSHKTNDNDSLVDNTLESSTIDDEMFMTPCSTPPGSEISRCESPTISAETMPTISKIFINRDTGLESSLYNELYERYMIYLTDLQVLVCKNYEYGHACAKTSSNFHLLDKFNISLQLERRHTNNTDVDGHLTPSITLFGNLPRILVHVNEQRLMECLKILCPIKFDIFSSSSASSTTTTTTTTTTTSSSKPSTSETLVSDQRTSHIDQETASLTDRQIPQGEEEGEAEGTAKSGSELDTNNHIFQFIIGQMILEVQSQLKSIVEIQVHGVRAGIIKKPSELNIEMSVHGLLLVDANQSFANDFELLVASHRHIEIDSISGSIKQSEPCSPLPPGSPKQLERSASPFAVNAAISNLPLDVDEALITIDIHIMESANSGEPLQIACVTFNNLDVIANQETIVELFGFGKRIWDNSKHFRQTKGNQRRRKPESPIEHSANLGQLHTDISFDFHRLNILILRSENQDDVWSGRKVCTLTMNETKINATFHEKSNLITGELGGIQIIDITPECNKHQRIFSVGKNPLAQSEENAISTLSLNVAGEKNSSRIHEDMMNALNFEICRYNNSSVELKVRMASVLYTHCPRFIEELYLCVKEFKQYFRNFVDSLRNKASNMAMGLVQSIRSTNTTDLSTDELLFDVVLSSPVIVLPTSNESTNVLVANLGKITVSNCANHNSQLQQHTSLAYTMSSKHKIEGKQSVTRKKSHFIEIRNINLFSLNMAKHKNIVKQILPTDNLNSYNGNAVPILHNTAIHFQCVSESCCMKTNIGWKTERILLIEGSVTQNLQISLTQQQYNELCDALNYATCFVLEKETIGSSLLQQNKEDVEIDCDLTTSASAKTTIEGGEIARDSAAESASGKKLSSDKYPQIYGTFTVPILKVDLRNKHNIPLIQITFQEFNFQIHDSGTKRELEIRLRSVLMEDLKCPPDSKFRNMVNSSDKIIHQTRHKYFLENDMSMSCPNLSNATSNVVYMSVPSNLNLKVYENFYCHDDIDIFFRKSIKSRNKIDNLVIYKSVLTKKPENSTHLNLSQNSIDFNSLDLVISNEKWFMIFDFFGLISNQEQQNEKETSKEINKYDNKVFRTMQITINSLNLILIRNEIELAKANISNVLLRSEYEYNMKTVDGYLGSISIYDLTPYGKLYQEKFATVNKEQALTFTYKQVENPLPYNPTDSRNIDANAYLKLNMSSVKYIHTKRFIMELHMFLKELMQLQSPVLRRIKGGTEKQKMTNHIMKVKLDIHADSPIVLLPVSYRSNHLLIANLGKFTLVNQFCYNTNVSKIANVKLNGAMNSNQSYTHKIIMDVMYIDLVNINLYTGERQEFNMESDEARSNDIIHVDKNSFVQLSNSIFNENCYLKLTVIRCLEIDNTHQIPDISINGTLSELNGLIDLKQYKLIRGFLNYNLGEVIDDILYDYQINLNESIDRLNLLQRENNSISQDLITAVWMTLSINFTLENVTVYLAEPIDFNDTNSIKKLVCFKFIKSTLYIDTFSDGSQDIDLILSEIQVLDAKDYTKPATSSTPSNIFKFILKPLNSEDSTKEIVQAEIHSRRRNTKCKYTIMLNNMRIMAILDFLIKLKNFLSAEPYMSSESHTHWSSMMSTPNYSRHLQHEQQPSTNIQGLSYDENEMIHEVVLNITNSEIVFVENTSAADTNAIILKSTTIFSYKPQDSTVPISININHLEIFSCILDAEYDTSLSIIDPFTVNMELRNNCFQITIQNQLCVRLSYNDVMLFIRMMRSIPKQTITNYVVDYQENPSQNHLEKISSLIAMGFKPNECWYAMEMSNYNLREATMWLTRQQKQKYYKVNNACKIQSISLRANCISICIIDDCLDADVPLLELSLSRLTVKQKIQFFNDTWTARYSEGDFESIISSDYYNRRLSGWEPMIESWECTGNWIFSMSQAIPNDRFSLNILSKQILKLNITSALVELFDLVRRNWLKDYYGRDTIDELHRNSSGTTIATSSSTTTTSITAGDSGVETNLNNYPSYHIKRRHPFVPFALKNLTGGPLLFKIFYSQAGGITRTDKISQDFMCNWIPAQHNQIVPFDCEPQNKQRHLDSHKMNMHQILVQIHGWTLIGPISIDKEGVFFRYASLDVQYTKKTRIIFDISLFGSAQKLITVKSALNMCNTTNLKYFLRMQLHDQYEYALMKLEPNERICMPLALVDASIQFKPYIDNNYNRELYELICNDGNGYIKRDIRSNQLEINGSIPQMNFSTQILKWSNCVQESIQGIYTCTSDSGETFCCFVEIHKDKYPLRGDTTFIAGHTITIMAPLKLKNLLCCDLFYEISSQANGFVKASEEVEIYIVDVSDVIYLNVSLDNYKLYGQLKIPLGHTGVVESKLKLYDVNNRELCLHVSIQSLPGRGIDIYISAPIWIENKTGLALIFRQEGTAHIGSGQFEEHENARQLSPLMFSFSDQEGSPLIEIRLGKMYGENNQWCPSFSINKETSFRQLRVDDTKLTYNIGINVQRGKGLYCCSTFITLSPRYQLYNQTSYKLAFAQKCDVQSSNELAEKPIVALPNCNFPFHWPNCHQELLLCVRVADDDESKWSQGFTVNETKSLYINIRNSIGEMTFLRLEVILHCGTYLLHFVDAYTLPPPLRIDNYSEVVIYFRQKHLEPQWRTMVKPQSSLSYVLDDPLGSDILCIEAPECNYVEYPLQKIDYTRSITYANFIYIAFKDTFPDPMDTQLNDTNSSGFVLAVKDRRVIITHKCAGDRSQLWLMNSFGQLEHEGSSPPAKCFTKYNTESHSSVRLVLDLEKPANPTEYTKLVVRPQNNQKLTTQTWRFDNGRLMCHSNMCVQVVDGFKAGNGVVLGRITMSSRQSMIPIEQCIEIQKLRPGSGQLEVISKMDGPIHSIQIHDIKAISSNIAIKPDPLWNHRSIFNTINTNENNTKSPVLEEFFMKITLLKGIGISLVTRMPYEELMYISLENIMIDIELTSDAKVLHVKVEDIQIDNQLLDSQCPVLLHTLKSNDDSMKPEALRFNMKVLPSSNENAVIFENISFNLKPCVLCLEERLILKTALFINNNNFQKPKSSTPSNFLVYHIDDYIFSKNSKRFYLENFSIGSTQFRLSVLTASKLAPELWEMKKSLGLTLIKFEDAVIEFDKFVERHQFETYDVYMKTLKSHYIKQLLRHAGSILGTVDFLGNPLGFAYDISEGVSGLIFEGSVKSLVKNVTHGISNSTAKLTESISDSLGRVVLDDHDNETRQKILEVAYPSTGGHLAAGLKGFGFGLLGGVTSIVRHTYVGAQSDGFPGFLSGLGKGLVGTITKPIIGVLDLASETASAVRETSRGPHRTLPERRRLPRCVIGVSGGLLPNYSLRQSKGQQYLYIINKRNYNEKLIYYEPTLCNDEDARLRLLVSTKYIRIFSPCDDNPVIMFECHLSEVLSCHPLTTNIVTTAHGSSSRIISHSYIEISTNRPKITRPRIRCQSEDVAERASRCISYAKAVYDEQELSLMYF